MAEQNARDLIQLKKSLTDELDRLKRTILELEGAQKKSRIWVQKSFDERAKDLEQIISDSLAENTKTVETQVENMRVSNAATRGKKSAALLHGTWLSKASPAL